MDASLALRWQFARNFANNSVRIVLGTTSLASKWVAKGLVTLQSRNRRHETCVRAGRRRVSYNGVRSRSEQRQLPDNKAERG